MDKVLYINLWASRAEPDYVQPDVYTDQGEALDDVNEGSRDYTYAGTVVVDGQATRLEDYSLLAREYARKQTAEWAGAVSVQRRPGL